MHIYSVPLPSSTPNLQLTVGSPEGPGTPCTMISCRTLCGCETISCGSYMPVPPPLSSPELRGSKLMLASESVWCVMSSSCSCLGSWISSLISGCSSRTTWFKGTLSKIAMVVIIIIGKRKQNPYDLNVIYTTRPNS